MKKLTLITFVTLATVWFTQTLSAQGLITSQPPAGWPSGQPWPPMPTVDESTPQGGLIIGQPPAGWPPGQPWPPMPTVDETTPHPPPVLPPSPCLPIAIPPELVLPNHGVVATTAGLTPVATPEPSTAALLAVSGLAAWFWRRRV